LARDSRLEAPLARRDLMLLLLAFAGAGVDAVSFLGFGRVFVANQTGNTIVLVVALVQGQAATGLRAAVSVVGFVLGTAVAELVMIGNQELRPWPSAVSRALLIELGALGILGVGRYMSGPRPVEGTVDLLVGLAALAMGVQSAAVLRLGVGVATTYISGTMTMFAIESVRLLHLVETAPRSEERKALDPVAALAGRGPWLSGATWIAYAIGAAVNGLLFLRLGDATLILPIVALVAVLVAEPGARRP
jgi:uncharacterized membrane protein YoaK (UPF0700 family)